MPRNMSFALTEQQVRDKTKTVTRRQAWRNLKPGTLIQPVQKAMGLKKGEKVTKLGGLIRIVSNTSEPICSISKEDVMREGFPNFTQQQFIDMYCQHNNVKPTDYCRRIEFRYV